MSFEKPTSDFDKTVSVFTLNVRFGLADDGPNRWEFRKKGFPVLLKQYQADFMAFQEVNDFQGQFLTTILGSHDCIGKRTPAPSFWQNNLIFFKNSWQCIGWEHFFLSATPDIPSRSPDSKWPRQCTIGIFEQKKSRVIVINTHFDFDEKVQVESAHYIMKRLLNYPSDIPAILVGDFNCSPSQACHRVFTGQDRDPRIGTERFFKPVFPKPYPGTHHGFSGNSDKKQIDWIMYSGHIRPVKWEVIREKFAGIYPSDHFPLYAVFES